MCKSTKQKLNIRSLTESEVVGASEYIPGVVWAEIFLKRQGIILEANELFQDNQSAIKLENTVSDCVVYDSDTLTLDMFI